MNVKTLVINIRIISLIHTSSINDIQYKINMLRYNGTAVVTTMWMLYWISLLLLVWKRQTVLVLMMSVLTFTAMMGIKI